ncbi:MAG: hypothetical protein ACI9XO_002902 [Paraglaciecola sp.]|jgi:hypothetical protein
MPLFYSLTRLFQIKTPPAQRPNAGQLNIHESPYFQVPEGY